MFFSRIALCLLHLSTCLTGCVYDQQLGLYWLNMVEAPLLNQIPCGSLICTASVDFICWNCAFDIVMCKFITDLFFTDVGLVLTVYLRAKQIIHFRNDTEKEMFELLCSFLGLLFVSYT